jgi:hypothetical protein
MSIGCSIPSPSPAHPRGSPPPAGPGSYSRPRAEKGGLEWYCVEGPCVLRHNGRHRWDAGVWGPAKRCNWITRRRIPQLRCAESLGPSWLLEVNCRLQAGDGRYGVLFAADSGEDIHVLIDALGGRVVVRDLYRVCAEGALPPDFLPSARHQLLAAAAGEARTIRPDGLPNVSLWTASLRGAFALETQECSAAFRAIALTDH